MKPVFGGAGKNAKAETLFFFSLKSYAHNGKDIGDDPLAEHPNSFETHTIIRLGLRFHSTKNN